ncbi:MAG: GNAT family N-acetyltransferase [Patescibacteria group bacterium]
MEIRLISKSELWGHLEPHAGKPAIGILFAGDRLSCCDEALAAFEADQFLGAVTLAPQGEMGSGEPTIVGIWVHYDHRGNGVGQTLLEAAVRRMIERGLTPVRLDVMSGKAGRIIERLPRELRDQVVAHSSITLDSLLDS